MAISTTIAGISSASYSVEILATRIETNLDKGVQIESVPKSTDSNNKTPASNSDMPLNMNIDLKKLKNIITITGILLEETAESALTKADNLMRIMGEGGTLTLQWKVGTTTLTRKGTITKASIAEEPFRVGNEHPTTQLKSFSVKIQFSAGKVIG